VKIVAIVVREMNFARRDLGQIIVASAILEDTIGWMIIAVAFGLASAGAVDAWSLGRAVAGTALFIAASLTVGRRIVFNLIRWANDNLRSEFPVITMILVIMIAMVLTTQFIGVNTVLGAFVAGILIGESPILTRHIDEQLRGLIVALFMPVFFGLSGLSADLTVLANPQLALLAVGIVAIASVGKFSGAFVGGKLGGLSGAESLALGCALNARGSTEVIVATIGLSMGVLSQNLFTLIVTMAVLTTTAMPPMLRWALRRLPLHRKERRRLDREELEERGFVTNLERLLLATDGSANGKLAARVAGVIAGAGGKPTTVIDMTAENGGRDPAEHRRAPAAGRKETAPSTAETPPAPEVPADAKASRGGDIIIRQGERSGPDAVAGEARKGYDLLVVGIESVRHPEGGFSKDISLVTKGFEGPLVVIDSHEARSSRSPGGYGKILLPVNGTDVSRRAAEIAFSLAHASHARVTALYVTRAPPAAGGREDANRAVRRSEQAVLKDIGALADHYEVRLQSARRVNMAPDHAILREAKRGYDLIVLGVSRRPGDTLFFGNTAGAVLDHSVISNLFVAS
jgi:K+:H+ antiporter